MAFFQHIPDGKTSATTTVTKKSDMRPPSPNCCVTCLARIIRKLKRQGKLLLATKARKQGGSLQCQYDPMSYSLNFDGGACGTVPDDEDYYFRFYAFSSRYVTSNAMKKRPSLPRESSFSTTSREFV